jgi:tetratricopeptide (TPR) repeat protein
MNRAIRVRDEGILGLMSFFFRDMHLQITQLHTKTFKCEKSFTVYRGQGITQEQFSETIVEGGIIAFDNFLLTTSIRDQALEATRNATGKNFFAVFFEINVDSSIDSVFARIGPISCAKKSKNEVLFTMFSVFRVCSIDKMLDNDKDIYWHIKLTLIRTPDDNEKIKELRKQTDGPSVHFRLAKFFIETGELDKAKNIHMTALVGIGELLDLRTRAHLHNELGFIYRKKLNWDLARTHYGMYMELTRQYIPSDPQLESPIMSSYLATAYFDHNDLEQAIAFFQEQLTVLQDMSAIDYDLIADAHTNLGTLFRRKKLLNDALTHQKASLEIRLKHCASKSDHTLANAYTNLACVYFEMHEYTQSVEHELKALNIRRRCLDDDTNVAISHFNLARALEQLNRLSEAFNHAKHAVKIAREVLPSVHVNLEMYEAFLFDLQIRLKR